MAAAVEAQEAAVATEVQTDEFDHQMGEHDFIPQHVEVHRLDRDDHRPASLVMVVPQSAPQWTDRAPALQAAVQRMSRGMPPSSAFLVEGFTWVTDSREIVRKRAAFAQSMLQLKKDRAKILGRIRQTH